jgi:hypothetical protein
VIDIDRVRRIGETKDRSGLRISHSRTEYTILRVRAAYLCAERSPSAEGQASDRGRSGCPGGEIKGTSPNDETQVCSNGQYPKVLAGVREAYLGELLLFLPWDIPAPLPHKCHTLFLSQSSFTIMAINNISFPISINICL